MMRSVDRYLSELPEERRRVVSSVRDLVLLHLPDGYRESVNGGMIAYEIPLERYPNTYNGQPLSYVAVASQKNHVGLYLMGAYADPPQQKQLKTAFAKAGKKLDMGKACLRFQALDDLAIAAVAQVIASMPPERYIERYEASRAAQLTTGTPRKAKTAGAAKNAKTRAATRTVGRGAKKGTAKEGTAKKGTARKTPVKKTKGATLKARKASRARATRVSRPGRTRRRS